MNPQTLRFTIFCIQNIAEHLQVNAKDIYQKMQNCGIISNYIIPCYDVLHTFSKEYIVKDLIEYLKTKGELPQ